MRAIATILMMAGALIVQGCGTKNIHVEVDEEWSIDPAVETLPVLMGIYFSPEFENFESTQLHKDSVTRRNVRYHFSLGRPSVTLFRSVFAGLFEQTVEVPAEPPLTGAYGSLRGVIEPRIDYVSGRTVRYIFVVYRPSGQVVTEWSVSVTSPEFLDYDNERDAIRRMTFVMREAAARFLVEFQTQPDIEQWLLAQRALTHPAVLSPSMPTEGDEL
jgi:hypothetical protein